MGTAVGDQTAAHLVMPAAKRVPAATRTNVPAVRQEHFLCRKATRTTPIAKAAVLCTRFLTDIVLPAHSRLVRWLPVTAVTKSAEKAALKFRVRPVSIYPAILVIPVM